MHAEVFASFRAILSATESVIRKDASAAAHPFEHSLFSSLFCPIFFVRREAHAMPADCSSLIQFLSRHLLAHQNKGTIGAKAGTFIVLGRE
jgi:hypothetical protein